MPKEEERKITFSTDKEKNFSKWFSEIVNKAELADLRYNIKGFVVFRPWAVLVIDQIYRLLECELQKKGHLPCYFPALIPEKNFKLEAEHVKGFSPELFWVTRAGNNKLKEKLAMRPTSETAFYQMYAIWIRSYNNLPLKLYQRCQVWRYETKATRPFIRGREFYWIESHDAFSTEKESKEQVREDMETTEIVMHESCCIPFIFFQRPQWDKFAGAVNSYAADCLMPDGRIVQQPATHLLGQGFSKAFNVKFVDKDGKKKYVWQTCYGPAPSRILTSVVATHGDNSGLVFPYTIAPIQIVIVPIYKKNNKSRAKRKAKEIEKKLQDCSIRVKADMVDTTPGDKFYFWEMKGIPIRIELGEREIKNKQLTIFTRDNKKRKQIKESKLIESITAEGKALDNRLRKKADEKFAKSIVNANSAEEIKDAINNKKIARVSFCSIEKQGEKCAEVIEKKLNASVRGIRIDKKEKPKRNCIICGKKAKHVVYIAKSY